jgi:CRISPR/Cas system-associated protein Cas10 (large subunit of type III CRISPR-Cas system)
MFKIIKYVIVETTDNEKTLQAEVLESIPDQDEKIDNLLNEANIMKLPVRNIIIKFSLSHKYAEKENNYCITLDLRFSYVRLWVAVTYFIFCS